MTESTKQEATPTLAQRKLAVLASIKKLEKENRANLGKGGGYDYVSHDQVTQMVRPLLADAGIVVEASMQKPDQGWVGIDLTLVNSDDSDDRSQSSWWVPFPDRMGPQGIGAVLSYAIKYALSKTFLIDAGDEDLDHGKHAGEAREAAKSQPPRPTQRKPDSVKAEAAKLGREIIDLVGGDTSAAADVLRDITKNEEKGFSGFRSVNGFSEEWQIQSARKRLVDHPLYTGGESDDAGEPDWMEGLPGE